MNGFGGVAAYHSEAVFTTSTTSYGFKDASWMSGSPGPAGREKSYSVFSDGSAATEPVARGAAK